MRKNFKRKYLKIGSFLAALNFSCSASSAVQVSPTVIYKSSGNSGAKTLLGASLPVTVLLIAAGGFGLNEYYGSQGHPWAHPLWSNKGIKAINKNGISKYEIKDEEANSRILAFFGKGTETLEKNEIDVLKDDKGKSIKDIFSKIKPKFIISGEKKEASDLCVITRNLTSGKNYIGIPGSYPYSNLVEMWKTICDENTKIENFDDKEINENKLHPIFNFIYGLKRNFGATNFGNAKIKFLFHSFKDENINDVSKTKDMVASVVVAKNNKEKNGILEIRLDFEKQNGDKPVSVSFYSPCSWEKEPVIVPTIEEKKIIEDNEQKAEENKEQKKDWGIISGAKNVWDCTGGALINFFSGNKDKNQQ
ncbi:MAG: hypothetical protein IJQ10_03275 [Clostridia bacterium]|nr:hypothetical protein [Clostridia bacterium]